MILKKAEIHKYKCINTTEFSLDKDVTCLVGKNEAGKTAILEALYKLKPVRDQDGRFDYVREYFKPEMLDYEKKHKTAPETVVSTEWELEQEDRQALETILGQAARKLGPIKIYKNWDNKPYIDFDLDEAAVVQGLVKESELEAKDRGKVKTARNVQELISQLAAIPEAEKERTAKIAKIKERFGDKTAKGAAIDLIWKRMPLFAFFSQYLRMPGQLAMEHFKKRTAANQLTDEDRVFTSLLEIIGMSVDGFAALNNYEQLTARLEAARDKLTKELRSFWPDGKHLSMDFKFDPGLAGDPPPFDSGWIFRARIRNERYGATTAFDQRSNGFIWFFSFLVWFTQLKSNYKTDLVILLDEPGMSLHGTAQEELLRFIDNRLASDYQVIYTTHSPFMLGPSNLHRSRPVEDVYQEPRPDEDPNLDPARGTKVFEKWWTADKLTLFPLRGCLAYSITQTLFIGPHNVLVEGPADLMYIDWFKRKLAALKRPTLDKRWVVTPCGSITKIGAFLNLFGANELHCAVLCDYADGSKKEIRSLGESAILASAEVLTCDRFAGKPQADLEDIIGDDFYAELVNSTYGLSGKQLLVPPKPTNGQPTGRIVKLAEDHMRTMPPEIPEFTHPGPADYLLRQGIDATYTGLEAALGRFQQLFEELNAILEKHLADKKERDSKR